MLRRLWCKQRREEGGESGAPLIELDDLRCAMPPTTSAPLYSIEAENGILND